MWNQAEILEKLAARGLLTRPWAITELAGNADRKADRARSHLLVQASGGRRLKLTLGAALSDARDAAAAFARGMPHLAPREVFFTRIDACDVWAVEAVDGAPLEALSDDGPSAARILAGLATLESIVHASDLPGDETACSHEWEKLATAVSGLSCWAEPERAFLCATLLPQLRAALLPRCTRRRWTNGDLTSSNISLQHDDHPVILDAEFGALSHFFPEERVRFRRVSPLCHHHPALLAGWWTPADPEWETFFQLRQLWLEHTENSDAYLARVTPERKAAIRHFAESRVGHFPENWPEAMPPQPSFPGEPVQLFWRDEGSVFSETNSLTVSMRAGVRQFVGFRTPGPCSHWRLDPAASRRPILVRSLIAVRAPGSNAANAPVSFTVAGGTARMNDEGTRIDPTGPDPQLHFTLPPMTIGLVADLQCL